MDKLLIEVDDGLKQALEEMAGRDGQSVTEEANFYIRQGLQRDGKWPTPTNPPVSVVFPVV